MRVPSVIFLAACVAAVAARPTCNTCDGPGSCASCPSGTNLCDWDCADHGSTSYAECTENLKKFNKCDFSHVVWPEGFGTSGGAADLASIRANPALAWAIDCICKSECKTYQDFQDWPARTTDTGACAVAASVDNTFEQCIATDPYKTCADITWPAAWGTADSDNAQTRIAIVKSNEEVAFAVDCMCKTPCAQFPTFNAYVGAKEGICAEARDIVEAPSGYEKVGARGLCAANTDGTAFLGDVRGMVASRQACMDLCSAKSECIGVTGNKFATGGATHCELEARDCDALVVSGRCCCCCCCCFVVLLSCLNFFLLFCPLLFPRLPSFITAQKQGLPSGFSSLCAQGCQKDCAITTNDNRGGDYQCWKKISPPSYEKVGARGLCAANTDGTVFLGDVRGMVASRQACMDLCSARKECIGVTGNHFATGGETHCELEAHDCDDLLVSGRC